MNKEEIIDAYLFLREHNHDIPDSTLDFMKDVALRELKKLKLVRCVSHANMTAYNQSSEVHVLAVMSLVI